MNYTSCRELKVLSAKRRNETVTKEMIALNEENNQLRNMASQFEHDFIMYGQCNLETTESITEYLNGMMRRQVFT